MKGIIAILKELGIEVPTDKEKTVEAAVLENYKTAEDYKKQEDQLEQLKKTAGESESTISTLKKQLEGIGGEDVEKLKKTIADLEEKNKTMESEYKDKIAERDFNDLLREEIAAASGRNAKAITALLDVETLKASKNQREDVAAALKKLTEAEDSAMLFGKKEAEKAGTGNPIGSFGQQGGSKEDDSAIREIMGLPTAKGDNK